MEIVTGTAETLSAGALFDMARYRHRVFIERLGWSLPVHGRMELDRFDTRETWYVLARTDDSRMTGVARLLPTDRPYLVEALFPELLRGTAPPHSRKIWELSRFAAMDLNAPPETSQRVGAGPLALQLLDAAMTLAAQSGANELITVSPVGVERLLERAGVVSRRLAKPACINGKALFICCIELAASLRQRAERSTH